MGKGEPSKNNEGGTTMNDFYCVMAEYDNDRDGKNYDIMTTDGCVLGFINNDASEFDLRMRALKYGAELCDDPTLSKIHLVKFTHHEIVEVLKEKEAVKWKQS